MQKIKEQMTEDYSHRKKEEACTKEQLKNRQVLIILVCSIQKRYLIM
ncbi:hypothetical protein BACFIN_07066 [Bacteroides finegoldii DSM 17565]|nr:hypothetical protein BACFIN_07066 [Bacteroides finegoldii DSM 17565]